MKGGQMMYSQTLEKYRTMFDCLPKDVLYEHIFCCLHYNDLRNLRKCRGYIGCTAGKYLKNNLKILLRASKHSDIHQYYRPENEHFYFSLNIFSDFKLWSKHVVNLLPHTICLSKGKNRKNTNIYTKLDITNIVTSHRVKVLRSRSKLNITLAASLNTHLTELDCHMENIPTYFENMKTLKKIYIYIYPLTNLHTANYIRNLPVLDTLIVTCYGYFPNDRKTTKIYLNGLPNLKSVKFTAECKERSILLYCETKNLWYSTSWVPVTKFITTKGSGSLIEEENDILLSKKINYF